MRKIITFGQFYDELNEAKTVPFRQSVNNIVKELEIIKNYNLVEKINFSNIGKQTAFFKFHQFLPNKKIEGKYFDPLDIKLYNLRMDEFEKLHNYIIGLFNIKPSNLVKSKQGKKTIYTYTGKTKEGYDVEYVSMIGKDDYGTIYDEYTIIGKESDDSETKFTEYPEYIPGKILVSELDQYYQIVKRSGKTIYTKEIKHVIIGHDNRKGERNTIVNPLKDEFMNPNKVFTSRLPNPKIEGYPTYLWDGRPITNTAYN